MPFSFSIWMSHLLVSLGLQHAPTPLPGGPVYLDRVDAPRTVTAGEVVDVEIGGNLPNPAYTLLQPEIKRADHHVTIFVASKYEGRGMAIQMLSHFSRKVSLLGLTQGKWTITVDTPARESQSVEVEVLAAPTN